MDDKLREILQNYCREWLLASDNSRTFKPQITMTGQEWYDRFQQTMNEYDRVELETTKGDTDFMAIPVVMKAAKRAANIE